MAYTAQEIIDAAVQRSDLNNPDLVPPAQLLTYLSQFERAAYTRAARINPEYFGTDAVTEVRADETGAWDIATTPGKIAALTRVYIETIVGTVGTLVEGDKVNLIGLRWPDIDLAPRAYVRGRVITEYEGELGVDSSNYVSTLRCFYSPLPVGIATLSQTVGLPDEWADMLILPLAKVLAIRDGRIQEAPAYDAEMSGWATLFDEAMMVYDHGVRRPMVAVPAVPIGGKG